MSLGKVFVTEHDFQAEGSDEYSTFKLTGSIFEDGLVQFVKQYNGNYNHHVIYRGNFNKQRTVIGG